MNEPLNTEQAVGKILVMEEDPVLRRITGKMLVNHGYEVSSARDGMEAAELYLDAQTSGRPFDIAILDLTVDSGIGGVETIQKLIEMDSSVKGIVSSGHIFDDVICNYREYGFCGVLKKPFGSDELTSLVYELSKSS